MNPDIIFITAHDVGRHLGCYGVSEVRSERIDRLAATGVRFTDFHSNAPQCSPSRAAYMTGRFPHETGVLGICSPAYGFDLSPEIEHLSNYVQRLGYRRLGLGEVHETLSPERYFDDYDPMSSNGVRAASSELVVRACSLIEDAPSDDRPLYLQVGFREAHRPFVEQGMTDRGVCVPAWIEREESAINELERFQGSIHRLDREVGALLDAVEGSPRADNTLVVFLSDHGIPFPRAKHTLYEAGCEAAAILRWPARGWVGGRAVTEPVSGIDLLPTLLGALHIESHGLRGRDLGPALEGASSVATADLFSEQNYHVYLDASRALRSTRFKLIANFSPGRAFFDSSQSWRPATRLSFPGDTARTMHRPFELYDLELDPLERNNLADDPNYRRTLDSMRTKLHEWMVETNDPLLSGLPEPPFYRNSLNAFDVQHEDS